MTPCLYIYGGRQDKTNITIRNIIAERYTAEQDGIPGNDDAGSMSAWVAFNLMGFYPLAGQDIYLITSPHFDEIKLNLGENKELKIISNDLSQKNIYIKKVMINGKEIERAWFRHSEIANGGILEFYMTDQPENDWEKKLPPHFSDIN